jgi:transcription elongation factor SPT6
LDQNDRKKLKKLKAAVSDSEEDEEDDEDRIREELKDLIDDRPIEGMLHVLPLKVSCIYINFPYLPFTDIESDADSDVSGGPKRKKSDDEDELDDRLEDEDYDLIEENLGVKVQRVSF